MTRSADVIDIYQAKALANMIPQPVEITTLDSLFATRTQDALSQLLAMAPDYCGYRLNIIQTESGSEILGGGDLLMTLSGRASPVAISSLPDADQDALAQFVGNLFIHETGLEKIISEIAEDIPEFAFLGYRMQLWIFTQGAILAPFGPERILTRNIPQAEWGALFHILVEGGSSNHGLLDAQRRVQILCDRLQGDVLGRPIDQNATSRMFVPAAPCTRE